MSRKSTVKSLADYLEAVLKIKESWSDEWSDEHLAFRGQEDASWHLASSAERRLEKEGNSSIDFSHILDYHEDLLEDSKRQNYHKRKQEQLSDLELLADLRHHGAATCLTDFTRNAFVALWMACQKTKENEDKNGKVFVINTADVENFWEMTHEDIGKSIRDALSFETCETDEYKKYSGKPIFWYWKPAGLNSRITTQHSLLIFGSASPKVLRKKEITISGGFKKRILEDLECIGINGEYIFPDFVGFADAHRSDASISSFSNNYRRRRILDFSNYHLKKGIQEGQRGNYKTAIENLNKAINELELADSRTDKNKNPKLASIHTKLGDIYRRDGEYNESIENLNKAINELKPTEEGENRNSKLAYAYALKSAVYVTLDEDEKVKENLEAVIRVNTESAYANILRGLRHLLLYEENKKPNEEDLNKAIDLLKDAIESTDWIPNLAYVYYNLGYAYLHKGCLQKEYWKKAESNLIDAKNMGLGIASLFSRSNGSVSDFEFKNDVELPKGIKAILMSREDTTRISVPSPVLTILIEPYSG